MCDDPPEFNVRAEKLAARLALLNDAEFWRYHDLTRKKQERIVRRLGYDTSSSEWQFISMPSEHLNALAFVHVRWQAHLIEFMRREIRNRKYEPLYSTMAGRYL